MLKKLRREMDRFGYVRRSSSGEPSAHSLNSDLHAVRFPLDGTVVDDEPLGGTGLCRRRNPISGRSSSGGFLSALQYRGVTDYVSGQDRR
jgi:hypothetical protein